MDVLSIIIILFVVICFVLALRYIYKNRGKGCSGNCGCCRGCSAKQRKNKN